MRSLEDEIFLSQTCVFSMDGFLGKLLARNHKLCHKAFFFDWGYTLFPKAKIFQNTKGFGVKKRTTARKVLPTDALAEN